MRWLLSPPERFRSHFSIWNSNTVSILFLILLREFSSSFKPTVSVWKCKVCFVSSSSNRGYQGHKTKGGDLRAKGGCNIYEVQRIIVMHAYIKPHSTHVELASCMLMMCYFSIHHWLLRLVRLLLKPLKNIQMNSYTLGGPYFSIPYNLLP